MVKNATSKELIEALNNHLLETVEQVKRLERVFEILGSANEWVPDFFIGIYYGMSSIYKINVIKWQNDELLRLKIDIKS